MINSPALQHCWSLLPDNSPPLSRRLMRCTLQCSPSGAEERCLQSGSPRGKPSHSVPQPEDSERSSQLGSNLEGETRSKGLSSVRTATSFLETTSFLPRLYSNVDLYFLVYFGRKQLGFPYTRQPLKDLTRSVTAGLELTVIVSDLRSIKHSVRHGGDVSAGLFTGSRSCLLTVQNL